MAEMRIRQQDATVLVVSVLVAVSLGLIAGYRPFGIGRDFLGYFAVYLDIRANDAFSYFRFEPGFMATAWVSRVWLNLSYMSFVAILMTVSLLIKFRVLSRLHHPMMAILFYIACWYPVHENTQVRIAFAISLLFLATRYMFEHRWFAFAGLALLATTFHTTAAAGAIVLVAAYWASAYRLFYGIVGAGLSAVLISATLTIIFPLLVQFNELLETSDPFSARPNVFSLMNIAILSFLLCSWGSGSLADRRGRTFFLVTCAGLGVFIGFLSVPVLAHRMKELLVVFMTFIAFEYRLTWQTLPQAILALIIVGGSFYSSVVTMGLFAD